jgi:hypothetical protein
MVVLITLQTTNILRHSPSMAQYFNVVFVFLLFRNLSVNKDAWHLIVICARIRAVGVWLCVVT